MKKMLPIGIDDFKEVISGGYYYTDKTLMIKELLDSGAKVTFIPRPRRFGKTLNMTMLKYFFEKTDASYRFLFDGLIIVQEPACMKHQGKYSVIFLTFKEVKFEAWSDCYDKLKMIIAAEFRRHAYLLKDGMLDEQEKEMFHAIVKGTGSQAYFESSLQLLTAYLHKYHGTKPIILIDEYDVPIHAGFIFRYYTKVISFMRGFLCGGLKGNVDLEFGVLTGILRVAKESIFSGINNLKVCSLLSDRYADKFGFIQAEVNDILAAYKLSTFSTSVRSWYNGYAVGSGGLKVYNPWSILNFVDEGGRFGPYWVNTSDNLIVQHLVQQASADVKKDFELILDGKTVNKVICEDIVFPAVYQNTDAIWSFLVFAGYLTWHERENLQVKCSAELCAPNAEVLDCFKTLVDRWFGESIGSDVYKNMLSALAQGDVPAFEYYFQHNIVESLSYFDVSGKTPERVYHAYVLGMLVGLGATHEVKSNRESGFGRYDVCLIPKDVNKPGVIIEFKVFNKNLDRDLKAAAKAALAQIEQKNYEAELRSRGIGIIIKLAIVFKGKKVMVAKGQ